MLAALARFRTPVGLWTAQPPGSTSPSMALQVVAGPAGTTVASSRADLTVTVH